MPKITRRPNGIADPLSQVTLAEQVYRFLADEIVAGRFLPGHALREIELAAVLKVSRTPIREAIRQLTSTGLVEVRANRGAIVRELTPQDVTQMYQVREALEGQATRLATGKIRPEDFDEFDRLAELVMNEDGEIVGRAVNEYDRVMHRVISNRAANPLLETEINRFHDLMSLIRVWTSDGPEILNATLDEHRRIHRELRVQDADQAEKAMREHLRNSGQRNAEFIAKKQAAPDDADESGE
ncbi:GntR family transcriptional regulator [Stratiformator vulcanicus]|uniref:HTH-type transcriptional regulator LutR n=1 Tax=Stratiformator vulcanicus TaxID=2527980 RepID=A0A517R5X2_9PLAN|nr:GntR family transcriptional regulator [Stratiformator vulcanicus]QDT39262.1 HTH-type transcriptional regulator LutR [Stratiformator vulcanicus]